MSDVSGAGLILAAMPLGAQETPEAACSLAFLPCLGPQLYRLIHPIGEAP